MWQKSQLSYLKLKYLSCFVSHIFLHAHKHIFTVFQLHVSDIFVLYIQYHVLWTPCIPKVVMLSEIIFQAIINMSVLNTTKSERFKMIWNIKISSIICNNKGNLINVGFYFGCNYARLIKKVLLMLFCSYELWDCLAQQC